MKHIAREATLAFLIALGCSLALHAQSGELVEVRQLDPAKMSAIKDAESIVERLEAALEEAKKRLAKAKEELSGGTEWMGSLKCLTGQVGKRPVFQHIIQGKFVLIYKLEVDCREGAGNTYHGRPGGLQSWRHSDSLSGYDFFTDVTSSLADGNVVLQRSSPAAVAVPTLRAPAVWPRQAPR